MDLNRRRGATQPTMRQFLLWTMSRQTTSRFGSFLLLLLILPWVIPQVSVIHIDSGTISSNYLNEIDVPARNGTSTAQIRHLPADGKVRILIMSACSGSTATKDMIRQLLSDHGHHPLKKLKHGRKNLHFELFKPHSNPLFEETKNKLTLVEENATTNTILIATFQEINRIAIGKDKVLNFKITQERWPLMKQMLSSWPNANENLLWAQVVRQNPLDVALCMIRDCVVPGSPVHDYGRPVWKENGTESKLCFERREHPELASQVQIQFDPVSKLPEFLDQYVNKTSHLVKKYRRQVLPSQVQTYETLFAWQWTQDEEVFQASLNAWYSLMVSFVDPTVLSKDIIEANLRPLQNTRPPPKPHRQQIYNYDEVVQVLQSRDRVVVEMDGEAPTQTARPRLTEYLRGD